MNGCRKGDIRMKSMKRLARRAAPALALAAMMTLAACGGGGGGSNPPAVIPTPTPDPTPDPINPPPPVDPGPQRGSSAAPGINQIPLDRIKITNAQMKDMFAITEQTGPAFNWHMRGVRKVACNSYTIQCDNPESFHGKHRNADGTVTTTTGSAPYTSITTNLNDHDWAWVSSQLGNMPNLKILSNSNSVGAGIVGSRPGLPSYLVIQGVGNQGSSEDYGSLSTLTPVRVNRIKQAVAANKMLFIAGWDMDANGNYVRHANSRHCKEQGVSEGCLWAQFSFPGVGSGNSYSAPHVASALASVLAVFPDTTPENLAKFAKASARKTGNGTPALLASSGGVGVADFTAMGDVVSALTNLPTGGRTNVTINGQSVTVGGRSVSLPSQGSVAGYITREVSTHQTAVIQSIQAGVAYAEFDKEKDGNTSTRIKLTGLRGGDDGFSLNAVPNKAGSLSLVGMQKAGDFFALAAVGERNDFFGFSSGHGEVLNAELSAGHKNAFLRFEKQFSNGGIGVREAEGESLGFTIRKGFDLTEKVFLSAAIRGDRFLGGEANIPFGKVDLSKGGWDHRVSLSSDIAVDKNATVSISAGVRSPATGDSESNIFAKYSLRF